MNKGQLVAASAIVALAVSSASAAELGRRRIGSGEQGQPAGEVGYRVIMTEGLVGLEASLLWHSPDAEAGAYSYDKNVWAPELSLFYGVSRCADIRLTGKYLSLEDDDNNVELDMLRVGPGAKFWFPLENDFVPYLGASLNYYNADADNLKDIENTFGVSAEVGIAYLMSEMTLVRFSFQGETFLGDAKAKNSADDASADISLSMISFGLGVSLIF